MTKLPARLSNQQLKSTKRKKEPNDRLLSSNKCSNQDNVRHLVHCTSCYGPALWAPHNIGGANVFELGEIGGCTQEKYQLTKRQRSADILHCYTDWLIDYMWMGVAH